MDKDAEINRLRVAVQQAEKLAADYKRAAELAQANERSAVSAQRVTAHHNLELRLKLETLKTEH